MEKRPQPVSTPPPVPTLFKVAIAPLQSFFRLEASSGILLALCAVAAMVWANSPWAAGYFALFEAPLSLGAADPAALGEEAAHWGSYYEHRPLVLAGHLPQALRHLRGRKAGTAP